MRSGREFVDEYRTALMKLDPSVEAVAVRSALRTIALAELCLHFVSCWLPTEAVEVVPRLMMGYPSLLPISARSDPKILRALCNLRHLAFQFGSRSVWEDACRAYDSMRQTLRCFNVEQGRVIKRSAAPSFVLDLLTSWLERDIPFAEREIRLAQPGDALIRVNGGDTILTYRIPRLRGDIPQCAQHEVTERKRNPPIEIGISELKRLAKDVDAREARSDWPGGQLPPLRLDQRVERLHLENFGKGILTDSKIVLEGAVHLVGMLSSGKSTLSLALTFALARRGKRVLYFVQDTVSGALLVERLRRHGISATVLASFRNREDHIRSLFGESIAPDGPPSLHSLAEIGTGFSSACTLDGWQSGLEVVLGRQEQARWPSFAEKPCHRLLSKRVSRNADNLEQNPEAEDNDETGHVSRSCPFFSLCPSQEQQRQAVTARVVVLTPQAFIYTKPDPFTINKRLTLPELIQFSFDLVIFDEVDAIQRTLDNEFAPRLTIMGSERGAFLPTVSGRSSEELRQRSGLQFNRRTNRRWQSQLSTLWKLIGSVYGLIQNEGEDLKRFYNRGPFTAASVLSQLWLEHERRMDKRLDDRRLQEGLTEVARRARLIRSALGEASREEDFDAIGGGQGGYDGLESGKALLEIARQVLLDDSYEQSVKRVEEFLEGDQLRDFALEDRRETALAILLAVTAELALSCFSWLAAVQPGSATVT